MRSWAQPVPRTLPSAARSTSGTSPARWLEAHDLPQVNLADALELLLLFRDQAPLERFELAATRWLGRYLVETPGVDLREALFVIGALAALAGEEPRPGALALVGIVRRHGLRPLEKVLRRWFEGDSTTTSR